MPNISVNIRKQDVDQLDAFVEKGICTSRSHVVKLFLNMVNDYFSDDQISIESSARGRFDDRYKKRK